jgi:hypothetical protein
VEDSEGVEVVREDSGEIEITREKGEEIRGKYRMYQ